MQIQVLVTGASGYLGERLCHELYYGGYGVRAFVRESSDVSGLPADGSRDENGIGRFNIVYGDVTDYQSLLRAFSGIHIVFHAAAVVEPWLPNPEKFNEVNVGGLKNVLKAYKELAKNYISTIVYISSVFALGPTDWGRIGDETQVHDSEYFCTEYEKSKVIADKIVMDAAAEGVPIVPVYPGVIYGPGKLTTGNILARLLVERFNGRLPGYFGPPANAASFVHVEDVVKGLTIIMDNGRPGERYLLTGENASFKDVFDLAAEITHTAKPRFSIPLWVLEVYGWLSVLFCRMTGKLPLISPPVVSVLRHEWAYSCEKTKSDLQYYEPRSLKEGLTEMLRDASVAEEQRIDQILGHSCASA